MPESSPAVATPRCAHGPQPHADAPGPVLRILLLCDFDRRSVSTILDHVSAFRAFSRHDYYPFNPVGREMPPWLNLERFDAIVIHYTLCGYGDYHLGPSWRNALAAAPGLKVRFIQDEYRRVDEVTARFRETGVNLLFTTYPEVAFRQVYPESRLPGVRILNTLTGYVPSYLARRRPDFDRPRPIDVGYRARGNGFYWLGRLFQDKARIGREFLVHARGSGLVCDVSSREEDRFVGRDWTGFLGRCRCVLGTESGASVVDFTGEVEDRVREWCERNPAGTFEEARERFFQGMEDRIPQAQISPRVFESIGCGCGLVLFEGSYSGVLQPERHYIPLRKDFANVGEVIERIRDRDGVRRMAIRAYDDVVGAGRYSYPRFVAAVDRAIEEEVRARSPRGTLRVPLQGRGVVAGAVSRAARLSRFAGRESCRAFASVLRFLLVVLRTLGRNPRNLGAVLRDQARRLVGDARALLSSIRKSRWSSESLRLLLVLGRPEPGAPS